MPRDARTAHVGPGVSTNAFANLPMAGDWLLSSRLTDQEACPTEAKPGKIPHVLLLRGAGALAKVPALRV